MAPAVTEGRDRGLCLRAAKRTSGKRVPRLRNVKEGRKRTVLRAATADS